MTLRLTETAPGVYTSSILDAPTGKSHNIAIIEIRVDEITGKINVDPQDL